MTHLNPEHIMIMVIMVGTVRSQNVQWLCCSTSHLWLRYVLSSIRKVPFVPALMHFISSLIHIKYLTNVLLLWLLEIASISWTNLCIYICRYSLHGTLGIGVHKMIYCRTNMYMEGIIIKSRALWERWRDFRRLFEIGLRGIHNSLSDFCENWQDLI